MPPPGARTAATAAAPSALDKDGPGEAAPRHDRRGFWSLALGSVGVVYGDVGTSPLYALREALLHARGRGIDRGEVLEVA